MICSQHTQWRIYRDNMIQELNTAFDDALTEQDTTELLTKHSIPFRNGTFNCDVIRNARMDCSQGLKDRLDAVMQSIDLQHMADLCGFEGELDWHQVHGELSVRMSNPEYDEPAGIIIVETSVWCVSYHPLVERWSRPRPAAVPTAENSMQDAHDPPICEVMAHGNSMDLDDAMYVSSSDDDP